MPSSITGGSLSVLPVTVTLNNSEIKALPSSPMGLVAAPGPGKIIRWLNASVVLDNSAGGYDAPEVGAFWQLVYMVSPFVQEASGFVKIVPAIQIAGIYTASLPALAGYDADEGYLFSSLSGIGLDIQNVGLGIADVYNGVSDYTGGNEANTLQVNLLYTIVDA